MLLSLLRFFYKNAQRNGFTAYMTHASQCFSSYVWVCDVWSMCAWVARGRGRRSRTPHAFASAARTARVVRDIRGDWNCQAQDYTRQHNVK